MENSIKHEPAFPIGVKNEWHEYYQTGMTLRDYFAGQAISGVIAGYHFGLRSNKENAEMAYKIADELIKQREL